MCCGLHRSNALLGHAYGSDFVYNEMILTGPGEQGEAIAKAVTGDKSLAGDDAPKPGEGPTKEERENGFYDVLFIGEGADGKTLTANVAGKRDPGYGSTSRMLGEAAVCLAQDEPVCAGGFWTPATALGQAYLDRLQDKAGLHADRTKRALCGAGQDIGHLPQDDGQTWTDVGQVPHDEDRMES